MEAEKRDPEETYQKALGAFGQYWASKTDDEFLDEIHNKIRVFYKDLENTGLFYLLTRLYKAYYGANLTAGNSQLFDSASLKTSGKKGEIVNFKVNHFRNLVLHTNQLTTAQRAAWKCRASNSDSASIAQTRLGDGLLDYYMREKKLSRVITKSVEHGLVLFEGYVLGLWNATAGETHEVDPETGVEIKEGDMVYSNHSLPDVIRDINRKDTSEHEWYCVRTYENRYNVAAKYKGLADKILSETSADRYGYETTETFAFKFRTGKQSDDTDLIPVWHFFHARTEAIPQGRYTKFTRDAILEDGALPYNKIPLACIKPAEIMETPYGYSPAADILGPQQAVDILSSTILTNQANGGVNNIWTKRGDDLTAHDLEGGMTHLQSDEKPEGISLTNTRPEIINFRTQIIGDMETLSGISSTVRGNPEANLKSGSALALVVAQSIQFATILEESYNDLIEDVGTITIHALRDFSKTKRVAAIVGDAQQTLMETFTADDLKNINRVTVERISALSKTISGRIELANNLLEKGFIKTAGQYITVLTTGRLDASIEGESNKIMNIRAENEALRAGEQVQVIATEHHEEHVREHSSILENPAIKRDPKIVQTVLNHIQEHIQAWRNTDPAILMITGQNPPPPGPGAVPNAPQPNTKAPGNTPATLAEGAQGPNAPANMPNMPNMPSLPPGSPIESQQAYENM